jgi:SAM-dependent methyltransferase
MAFVLRDAQKAPAMPGLSVTSDLFVDETRDKVKDYYGKELSSSEDLKTDACCTAGAPPQYIQDCIKKIHPEVVSRYYGCGLCLPQYPLEGATVLDLGSGSGRDVYIASQLVGPTGKVVGVDMTDEQLAVANEHVGYHAEKFGFANVEFKKGYLEDLADLDLEPNSFDVIISNCVINLCSDKEAVLKECLNLLKPGGELYFSDVYANRRVPKVLQEDEVLWGECLSGALYWNDFENMARKVGFTDPRLVEDAPITVQNKDVERAISESGNDSLEFYSATYRLWNLDLEPHCEDYGQAVIYKGAEAGAMERYPSGWLLDKHHYFEAGKIHPVCGNTYKMLHETRLRDHFAFVGNWEHHYGIFEGCGSSLPYGTTADEGGKGAATGGCC